MKSIAKKCGWFYAYCPLAKHLILRPEEIRKSTIYVQFVKSSVPRPVCPNTLLDYYQKLLHVELGYHILGSIHLHLELLLAMECIVFYPHAVFLLAG